MDFVYQIDKLIIPDSILSLDADGNLIKQKFYK